MGRRKIEIQPITHERNRSVTFLKRKNGLFKKAYELGVLCSVDVAVIIFEERAGHHLKLYQYCSGDIHDIVQRHIRYDGEKDTRTPHDFANNTNAKLDDAGDGDDDDGDDDDADPNPTRGGNKKRNDPKLKPDFGTNGKHVPASAGDVGLNVDMDYPLHRPMTIPQPPMPLHHSAQLPAPGGGSSLPLSTERHTSSGRLLPPNGQLSSQKKPRLAPNVSAGSNSKLTPDDSMYNGYLPSPTSGHPTSSYRQPSHQIPYNSYPGVASTPQQPFLPSSSFDFPSSSRGASISRTAGYNQRSSSSYPQPQDPQLQGIYHQLMRHNLPPGQPPNLSNSRMQQSPDLLSAFLDNDDHRPPPQPSQFTPMDWPTHGSSQPHSQAPPPPQQESGPSGDTSWLDFLSHSAPQPGGQQLHMTLPPANGRDGLSWERDRDVDHYNPSERSGGGSVDKGLTNGSGLMSPPSRKRPRAGSVTDEGRRPSPTSRGAAGVGQDSLGPNGDAHGPGIKEE